MIENAIDVKCMYIMHNISKTVGRNALIILKVQHLVEFFCLKILTWHWKLKVVCSLKLLNIFHNTLSLE